MNFSPYYPANDQRPDDIPLEDEPTLEQRVLERDRTARLKDSARKKGKGSIPFQVLETNYGLDGDYSPSDWGMERERTKD